MTVIGVVGQVGSGKDELLKYLDRKVGADIISTGDMVRETARDDNIPINREQLQKLSERLVRENGEDYFARRAIEQIKEGSSSIYGVTGIRTPADVRSMRKQLGDDFMLVHVDVSLPQSRLERLQARNEPRDPDNMDELLKQDNDEEQLFHLGETISMADVKINNDGTLGAFHSNIDVELIEPYLKQTE